MESLMGILYEKAMRPKMFRRDPEEAHERVAKMLSSVSRMRRVCRWLAGRNRVVGHSKPVRLFGLDFDNAVGMAAGFDKNAAFWPALFALGFGHVEIGTVTFQPQPGNPRPRIFRYPEEKALINRMGFNNDGAEEVARRLNMFFNKGRPSSPLGINIGKSKAVSLDEAPEDYRRSFLALADFADYFTINISSPNTPDLRTLQEGSHLGELLQTLRDANVDRAKKLNIKPVPMLVKIAPDLTYRQIDVVLETILAFGISGIIATNTTLARPGRLADAGEEGGLSGLPLRLRSTDIINYISRATGRRLPIIGAGGIFGPESAAEKLDAGASLVQIYTGMIFQGPLLARDIARGIAARQSDWVYARPLAV